MNKHTKRLEQLRVILRSESISYGELHELQSLAAHIAPGDVELLEAAGVPETVADSAVKVNTECRLSAPDELEHDSGPNGCHEDCAACAAEETTEN